MIISFDTETTGVDFFHGASPFFVTICDEEGEVSYWEWDVDPLTRRVIAHGGDLTEIREMIDAADRIVLQNAKFDVAAMKTLIPDLNWPWEKTEDTLIAGHLLRSNQPHDLTSMALYYLSTDITDYEDSLKVAVQEARKVAKRDCKDWLLAKAGLACMPSATDKTWRFDYWLPRALANHLNLPPEHDWWMILQEYGNADSVTTINLWTVQKRMLQERGLWEIYQERMKVIPVTHQMEQHGITASKANLDELTEEYQEESTRLGNICKNIAKSFGQDLVMPKGSGVNNSLRDTCLKLLDGVVKVPVTPGGQLSLSKTSMDYFDEVLPNNSKPAAFFRSLRSKRKRDTALSYMSSYQRFWNPLGAGYYVLHPSLNPTGTNTLRWSSSNPNEQNISKQEGFNIRYCFGPAPDREWWSLDYENIELRIPAYESGEEVMIELFEKPDDPPFFGSYHLLNASIVYPELFWPIAEEKDAFKKKYKATYYQWVKNGGFAIQYGCQERKADSTFKRAGAFRQIKEKMPKVAQLNEHYVQMANRLGYVETLADRSIGAQRGYPIYCDRDDEGNISPTIPFNYHIQSTACWALMRAMIKVHEFLSQFDGYYLIMQVHDEIVLDFPKGGRNNFAKIRKVRKLMESCGNDIGIPLKTSVSYHPKNWSEEE